MKVQRCEQHIIKLSTDFGRFIDDYCFKSKNLYNYANYIIRQEFIANNNWIRYNKLFEMVKNSEPYKEICAITGLGKGTVRSHLTKANEIGLCDYDHTVRNEIKVLCVDTGEIFNSLRDAEIKYGIKRGYLSGYLKGRTTLPVGNKTWKYYEESIAS